MDEQKKPVLYNINMTILTLVHIKEGDRKLYIQSIAMRENDTFVIPLPHQIYAMRLSEYIHLEEEEKKNCCK